MRAYAEYQDATSAFEELPPRAAEENRSDMINLFLDVRPLGDCGDLWLRGGRQEMTYGSQRLVTNRPWRNATVAFDGFRGFWRGEQWSLDAFWVRPIDFAQHVPNDHNFDNPDQSQEFYGAFASWKSAKERTDEQTFDVYFFRLIEHDAVVRGGNGRPGDFDANTLGLRWAGGCCHWLWEAEGAYQFGEFADDKQSAGFYVLGLGYEFADAPWKPTLWAFYDWASGDSDPTDGRRGTFNQLFPRGHYFLGWADVTGRQNIRDVNFRLGLKPHEDVTLTLWYHVFHLVEARDALYNLGGLPRRQDPTGAAGRDVGTDLDLSLRLQLHRQAHLLLGYTHFFAGDFLANTGVGDDVDFYYTQLSVRF